MKVLFCGYHNPHFSTITEYVEGALRDLGHEVVVFDDRQLIFPGRVRDRIEGARRFALDYLNYQLRGLAAKVRPDLCLVSGGHRVSRETICRLKLMGITTALWTIDAPHHFQPIIDVAAIYDYVFCGGSEAVDILKRHGVVHARWLPFGVAPNVLQKALSSTTSDKRYQADVAFVGSYYPNRAACLRTLTDIDLAIWGPGWGALAPEDPLAACVRGGTLTPVQWQQVFAQARINIVIHYQDGRVPCYQASPKVYEIMACGGFVLSDRQKDVLTLFREGIHLATFADSSDLKSCVRHYLAETSKRQEMAEAGRQEVLCRHTYRHRMRQWGRVVASARRRIKVVQLVEDMKVGGMERVIATIATQIDQERFDLQVWCVARGGDVADELRRQGVKVKVLNIHSYHGIRPIRRLAGLLRRHQVAVIHTHGYYASVIGRLAALWARVPVVFAHGHSTYYGYRQRHLWIERVLSFMTDQVICCSRAVRDFHLHTEGISKHKLMVIYNGIDPAPFIKNFAVSRQEAARPWMFDGAQYVTVVASLVPLKGHRYLLDAIGTIIQQYPRARFLIVGAGPLEADLKAQVRAEAITDHVYFLGQRRDVAAILFDTDVVVLPSCEREGLPIGILEAMAASKPVVATNVGGVSEAIIDQVNGFLVPPSDAGALALKIMVLLKDPSLRQAMGQKGHEIFQQRFAASTMLKSLEQLFVDTLIKKGLHA